MHKKLFNAYELLGVSSSASITQIKAAYKKKAHTYHPDKHGNSEPANTLFRLIVQAKEVLLDPQSRLEHDYALGIKTKPSVKPAPEIIYLDREKEEDIPWGAIVGIGLVGVAVGVAIGKRKKKKRKK